MEGGTGEERERSSLAPLLQKFLRAPTMWLKVKNYHHCSIEVAFILWVYVAAVVL